MITLITLIIRIGYIVYMYYKTGMQYDIYEPHYFSMQRGNRHIKRIEYTILYTLLALCIDIIILTII